MNTGNLQNISKLMVKPVTSLVAKSWAPFYCAHFRAERAVGLEEVAGPK